MEALKKKIVLNPKAGFRKIKLLGFACCSSKSHESLLISLFLLSSRKIHLPTEFDLMFTKHDFLRQLSDFQSRIDVLFCFGVQRKMNWFAEIEPQIFSALEIVPRPKLGERFRKYSRAFQPLWWRSLCLREFKRDSSPNNILLCHVKTSLDNWQPLQKDISKLPFWKTAELFGEFADLKKCLEFAD